MPNQKSTQRSGSFQKLNGAKNNSFQLLGGPNHLHMTTGETIALSIQNFVSAK